MKSSTIFAASVRVRPRAGTMLVEDPRIDLLPDGANGPRRFKIKAAETQTRRGLVNNLLRTRYAFRGYKQVSLPTDQSVSRFTLVAIEREHTIGTITVSFDGPQGLSVDDTFGPEVRQLRAEGRRICEFTKLAIDPTVGTKRVLAALFHVAYIVAHRIRGYDSLLIEVNPRHVRYYERMLGLQVMALERHNAGVNAPAVLLGVEFGEIMRMIGLHGGNPNHAEHERTLYPFAFSLTEEAGIISRMNRKQSEYQRRLAEGEDPLPPGTEFQLSDLMPPSGFQAMPPVY